MGRRWGRWRISRGGVTARKMNIPGDDVLASDGVDVHVIYPD